MIRVIQSYQQQKFSINCAINKSTVSYQQLPTFKELLYQDNDGKINNYIYGGVALSFIWEHKV